MAQAGSSPLFAFLNRCLSISAHKGGQGPVPPPLSVSRAPLEPPDGAPGPPFERPRDPSDGLAAYGPF